MVDMVDKELEEQLMEAGKKLLKLPDCSEELLVLLDQLEACLLRVEQSPTPSMHTALKPSLKALVTPDLFKHADPNVRVSIASCVSEITRITAPEAPYTDDQMKQIFQLIVGSFEALWDTSSRSFPKRVSILETVAKVRSCVVMLDLECDALILEMFQHFLKTARDTHPENVVSSMETIMTLVLVESEEITSELLHPLLHAVEKDTQYVLPAGRKLAEKVLENCRSKLQPCLLQAVKSTGRSPNEFSKIVASICQETSETTDNDDSVSGEHMDEEPSLPEKPGSDKPEPVIEEPKPETEDVGSEKAKFITSNGDARNLKDDSSVGHDSPMKEESSKPYPEVDEVDPKEAKSETETAKEEETKLDQSERKKRGRKPKIPFEPTEIPRSSKAEADKQTKKKTPSPENAQASSPPQDESVKVERRGRPRGKKITSKSGTDVEEEVEPEPDAQPEKPVEEEKEPEEKPEEKTEEKPIKRSHKKKVVKETEKNPSPSSDSEEKPLKKSSSKKVEKSNNVEVTSEKKQGDSSKKVTKKSVSSKKSTSPPKSAEKSKSKNEKRVEETTPKPKPKRKRTEGEENTAEKPSGEELAENMIGRKIQVWWPDDQEFYKGIVDSYDASKKKHKVLYLDGDEEILFLKKEKWEFVDDDEDMPDGEEAAELESHKKKKAKTSSDSATKQSKPKGKEASGSKSHKKKEASGSKSHKKKVVAPTTEEQEESTPLKKKSTPKASATKSKGTTPKAKEETPEKMETESENEEEVKTKTKTTPKGGANGSSSGKGKSESEVKEKESEMGKSGGKRRRR